MYSKNTNYYRCVALQLNMRQSKVAKSFEAQRRGEDMDDGENEAVTEREAENQRRGPRDPHYATRGNPQTDRRRMPPSQQQSKPRIIEGRNVEFRVRDRPRVIEEERQMEERGRQGVVQRKNERNKPAARRDTPDDYQRGLSRDVSLVVAIAVSRSV